MSNPEILNRLIKQLKAQGDRNASTNALSYLRKFGLIELNSLSLTEKGKIRNEMTPAQRAEDRRVKDSNNNHGDYSYDEKTNSATLKYPKK